jgi:hypothetical protein
LRNLNLAAGASMTVGISAELPCAAGTLQWTSRAKQSNDFSGTPGNDFNLDAANSSLGLTVTGACQLAFSGPPASAAADANITTVAFNPAGAAVQVELRSTTGSTVHNWPVTVGLDIDPGHNPGPGALSGTTSAGTTNGAATFGTLSIGTHGRDYELRASSSGITTGLSADFDIEDTGLICSGGPCNGNAHGHLASGSVSVASSSPGDILTVSMGLDALDCPGYVEPPVDVMAFFYSGSASKVVVYTIEASAVDRPTSKYQACYASTNPFTQRDGTPAPLVGGFYTGLLPDCSKKHPVPPCLNTKVKDGFGNVNLTILAPAGDPHIH